jgi:hypothetical protein
LRALHAFEGIGGITLGFERAGIQSAGGIDSATPADGRGEDKEAAPVVFS